VHVPALTSSAPLRYAGLASCGARSTEAIPPPWPSVPVIVALKCSGPSVTLDQRKASTEGSSTCSVSEKLSDCLMTLPSLRSVSPPSFPASELPSPPSLPASRNDLSVAAWLNSGLRGGSSAARLEPVEAERLAPAAMRTCLVGVPARAASARGVLAADLAFWRLGASRVAAAAPSRR